MFQRMIADFKDSTGTALRMMCVLVLAGFALLVMLSFLCAAGFVAIMHMYGSIFACLAAASLFLVIASIAGAVYIVKKRRAQKRAAYTARKSTKSAASSILADPMLLAAGMQIVRAVGIKKLIPLLAVGGVALGIFMNRSNATSDEETPADE